MHTQAGKQCLVRPTLGGLGVCLEFVGVWVVNMCGWVWPIGPVSQGRGVAKVMPNLAAAQDGRENLKCNGKRDFEIEPVSVPLFSHLNHKMCI